MRLPRACLCDGEALDFPWVMMPPISAAALRGSSHYWKPTRAIVVFAYSNIDR